MLLWMDSATRWQQCTSVSPFLSRSHCVKSVFLRSVWVGWCLWMYCSCSTVTVRVVHNHVVNIRLYKWKMIFFKYIHVYVHKHSIIFEELFILLYIHCSLWLFHTHIYAITVIANPQQINKSSAVQSALLFSACDLFSAVQHLPLICLSYEHRKTLVYVNMHTLNC